MVITLFFWGRERERENSMYIIANNIINNININSISKYIHPTLLFVVNYFFFLSTQET